VSSCGCHGSAGSELTARSAPGNDGQRQVHGLKFMKKPILLLLPYKLGICRLNSSASIPVGLQDSGSFFSITRTEDEISLVCRENLIPADCVAEKGFRALKVKGPLPFELTGILSSLLNPLARDGISIFAISTYDTDYILVKEEALEQTIIALREAADVIS